MTSQSSAYAQFRRSLDSRSLGNALACAAELKPLGLTDSLELLLLVRDTAQERYGRMALRWHARLTTETSLSMEEGQAVLALLVALPISRSAGLALAELLSGYRQTRLAETLVRWAREA